MAANSKKKNLISISSKAREEEIGNIASRSHPFICQMKQNLRKVSSSMSFCRHSFAQKLNYFLKKPKNGPKKRSYLAVKLGDEEGIAPNAVWWARWKAAVSCNACKIQIKWITKYQQGVRHNGVGQICCTPWVGHLGFLLKPHSENEKKKEIYKYVAVWAAQRLESGKLNTFGLQVEPLEQGAVCVKPIMRLNSANNPLKTRAHQYQSQTWTHKRFSFKAGKTEPVQRRSRDTSDVDDKSNSTSGNNWNNGMRFDFETSPRLMTNFCFLVQEDWLKPHTEHGLMSLSIRFWLDEHQSVRLLLSCPFSRLLFCFSFFPWLLLSNLVEPQHRVLINLFLVYEKIVALHPSAPDKRIYDRCNFTGGRGRGGGCYISHVKCQTDSSSIYFANRLWVKSAKGAELMRLHQQDSRTRPTQCVKCVQETGTAISHCRRHLKTSLRFHHFDTSFNVYIWSLISPKGN